MNMLNNAFLSLIKFANNRVFIDVAYSGCGSGCKYCYVESASEQQALASYEELEQLVDYLLLNNLITGRIISFCPNTEPFKSNESTKRVLFVMKKLAPYQCYIQVSTKEYLSDSLLKELNSLADGNRTLFINVSIPHLEPAKTEPGAADLKDRINSLKRVKLNNNLKGTLYIKPFFTCSAACADKYNEIIRESRPDFVCIGLRFDKDENEPCTTLYRHDDARLVVEAQIEEILRFSEKIEFPKSNIVYSSICAIARETEYKCTLNLWEIKNGICAHCVRRQK